MANLTYLQLCQKTARECGLSGSGPLTVLNQTGQLGRVVNWVAEALIDVESAHPDWQWMRLGMSFTTVAGQAEYPAEGGAGTCGIAAGTFGRWQRKRFRNYPTASGNIAEVDMEMIDYDDWRDCYSFGATRYVQSRPMVVAKTPSEGLALGPYPAVGYTVTGDYYRAPQVLVADTDTCAFNAQYDWIVIYKAMMYYGMYEAAPEVLGRGQEEFDKMMARMQALRLPELCW